MAASARTSSSAGACRASGIAARCRRRRGGSASRAGSGTGATARSRPRRGRARRGRRARRLGARAGRPAARVDDVRVDWLEPRGERGGFVVRRAADRAARAPPGAVYLALALHGLGAADIVGDDEAREVGHRAGRSSPATGVLPRFNGELIPDKPILYHWLAAVPCAVGGFSETAVRLPSALAAAALVAWTARARRGARRTPGRARRRRRSSRPCRRSSSRARVARPDALLVLLLSRRARARLPLVARRPARATRRGRWPRSAPRCSPRGRWRRCCSRSPSAASSPGSAISDGSAGSSTAPGVDRARRPRSRLVRRRARRLGRASFVHQHLVGRYVCNLIGDLPAGGAYSRAAARVSPRSSTLEHLPRGRHFPGRRSWRSRSGTPGATIGSAIRACASSSAGRSRPSSPSRRRSRSSATTSCRPSPRSRCSPRRRPCGCGARHRPGGACPAPSPPDSSARSSPAASWRSAGSTTSSRARTGAPSRRSPRACRARRPD